MKSPTRYSRRGGFIGTLVGLLIVIAIVLVLYFMCGDKSYVKTAVRSKDTATETVATVNLAGLHKSFTVYAAMNDGKFPASKEELANYAGLSEAFFTGTGRTAGCAYIPGQHERSPKSNVLIYQTAAGPDGMFQVLRVGGRVDMLSSGQLQAAVEQTGESLR